MNWTRDPRTRTTAAAAKTNGEANQLNSVTLPAQEKPLPHPLSGNLRSLPNTPLLPPSHFLQRKGLGMGLRTGGAPA